MHSYCYTCGLPNGLGVRRHRGRMFCSLQCQFIYGQNEKKDNSQWIYALVLTVLGVVAFVSVCAIAFKAVATEATKQAWSDDPDTRQWFRDQVDRNGRSCCGLGDSPLLKVDKIDGEYKFFWKGEWRLIPKHTIEYVDDTPRHSPVVWFNLNTLQVYCAKLLIPRG